MVEPKPGRSGSQMGVRYYNSGQIEYGKKPKGIFKWQWAMGNGQ
ncbi:MAG: hypothetical protein WAT91_08700 [Saprospiraceae bacterium]